jgi:SAM-dependent methyltransferase
MGTDPYLTDTYRWWHLETPSPEIQQALTDGWLRPGQRALDLGCGLGSELAHVAARGLYAVGVDLSLVALRRARAARRAVHFIQADALSLPFPDASFDVLLDRGCFHYIPRHQRTQYAAEAGRVLRLGGRFLLRACLRAHGIRNDVDEAGVRAVFAGWRIEEIAPTAIPSETRMMEALVIRLARNSRN